MILVGESINSTNKSVAQACVERNDRLIRELAVRQSDAGAHFLDVNAGSLSSGEAEALAWMVKTVQEATDLPLMIDTTDVDALRAALAVHVGKPIINSISHERGKLERTLPFLRPGEVGVVVLCVDSNGIPKTAEAKIEIATATIEPLLDLGMSLQDIYVDPLLQPIGLNNDTVRQALEVVRAITKRFRGIHTICGLSNVSFGLPARGQMHVALVPLLIGAGMDTVILDVCDARLMATVVASQALLGQDPYCEAYLRAHRKGVLSI